MNDDLIRMYNEAIARIHDADILSSSNQSTSDSSSILRVLGFEILLKCAIKLCGQSYKSHHEYSKLWKALPGHASKEILSFAKLQSPGHTDFSNLERVLDAYKNVILNASGKSFKEQHDAGLEWEIKGFPINDADVRYYPEELYCLIEALKAYIKPKISKNDTPHRRRFEK